MIYINQELCKGCYICIDICPRGVYSTSSKVNSKGVPIPEADSSKCVKCNLCTLMCPDQVIYIGEDD